MSFAAWLTDEQSHALDPVLDCLAHVARMGDRPSSPVLLRAGLALDEQGLLPFHQIEPALEQAGMRGTPVEHRALRRWRAEALPAILELAGGRAAVLLELEGSQALVYAPGIEEPLWIERGELAAAMTGRAVEVEPDPTREREGERPWDKASKRHWFWSEVWKARKDFRPVLLAAMVINLLALAVPLFTMNVYDRVIPNEAVSSLWVLAAGVGLALGFDYALRLARSRLVDEIGRKLDARYSQRIFEKVMNLPLAERKGSTGAFARRVSEYEQVRDFFASTSVVLLVDIAFMGIFLVFIALLAGWLVFVPITLIALMLVVGLSLQKAMGRTALDAQADASLQHSVLVEAIGGAETLKAARAEGQMLGRWRRFATMSATTQERMRRLTAIATNLAAVTQQAMSVALIIGGFYLFHAGDITMGAIIAIVMIAGRAMAPVGQFALLMTRAKQAAATLDSLQEMMEAPDERAAASRSIVPEVREGVVAMDRLSFRYPGAAVDSLSEVSLRIEPGERIGIIGRVASGKSTFGRVLCGLYPPSEGVMSVDGLDSRQFHPHQLREAFRYVGQDAELFSGTVRDNLLLGAARASDEQLIDAVRRAGADLFLAQGAAGFDLAVGERGGALSGGQRSLLVLARALVSDCKLLYLDEPTGAMDTQTERYFIAKLKDALRPEQTLLVSTHRHQMLSLVDRLLVIDQGRIIADGARDEVLASLGAAAEKAGAPTDGKGAA
ncbi:type I secretion system permease/ATPase [Sphingomicrobium astaxanthinifaciens]|uniref:type I secretion system permease/ATPase n=1 Tax=Sphingomicrobium astaxanthinifaciens TaxID=1227949 RepID=UPI001FCC88AF|nr:type I secretion system permease/ATPase [Sphingomicrobium astaxanthinifaciens]MCJ7420931.1 type I secretion system permease/ATPase [Sphingomicrobium astaxanthinifaciens]